MRALKNLLFPSWGFFARYDEFPTLMVLPLNGIAPDSGVTKNDEWFQVLQPRPWRWYHLFLNTRENLRLARLNVLLALIDRVNSWEGDRSQIRALKSYQGLISVCSEELRRNGSTAKEMRFKIIQPSEETGEAEDVFISAVEELVWRY